MTSCPCSAGVIIGNQLESEYGAGLSNRAVQRGTTNDPIVRYARGERTTRSREHFSMNMLVRPLTTLGEYRVLQPDC
jgi:hypothetical protein